MRNELNTDLMVKNSRSYMNIGKNDQRQSKKATYKSIALQKSEITSNTKVDEDFTGPTYMQPNRDDPSTHLQESQQTPMNSQLRANFSG